MQKTTKPVSKVRPASVGGPGSDAPPKGTFGRPLLAFAGSGPTGVGRAEPAPAIGRLTDALSGPLGAFAFQNLRIRPRQARSIASVERILSTAADMAFRHRRSESISIERISNLAGVTPQAAYRYFKDAHELVTTGLRCVVIREHERIIERLSHRAVEDEVELAALIVGIVLETCGRIYAYPSHVQADLIREYRQVGYEASLLMSEIICKDADGLDVRSTLDVFKASVALAATIAVATSFFSNDIDADRKGRLEDMLANLFVSVLRSGGGPSQAFREIGCRFGDLWAGDAG